MERPVSSRPAAIPGATWFCAAAPGHSSVVNGRFRGGWTTRHYGNPAENVHAIQMELAQATHLATEAPPFAYDADKAGRLRGHLKTILTRIEAIALSMKPGAPR